MSQLHISQAHREVLWNVSAPANQVLMYLIFSASMLVLGWGLYRRLWLWSQGKADRTRFADWAIRISSFFRDVFLQRRTNRDRQAIIFHSLIAYGFLVLVFATTMVFIDHDLNIKIYQGRFYLLVTLLSDLFGLGLFFGVLHATARRFIEKPSKLHTTSADILMLSLLALMVAQGFLLEALRIHATNDVWANYSPIGFLLSEIFWGLSAVASRELHFGIWWFHTITVFVFLALLPYTKFLHIVTSSANLFFRDLQRQKGALRYPGDIEQMIEAAAENDAEFFLGRKVIGDLTWKERLDLDACTACGRCQDVCPASNSGKVLSPKWLILDARDHMLALRAELPNPRPSFLAPLWRQLNRLDTFLISTLTLPPRNEDGSLEVTAFPGRRGSRKLGQSPEAALASEVMDENVFWACTTCRACMEVCPVGIEHVDLIIETRRAMTMIEGSLPREAQASCRAIETRGNPFGPADQRSAWMQGLNVPLLKAGDEVDVLYWVGCIAAFDQRKQKIARAMVKILNTSGVRWGTLGNQECCTGDPARRLGDENLFQTSAKKNKTTLASIQYKALVTHCPHCFNSFKNEYPAIGTEPRDTARILHHSQFIQELLDQKKLSLQKTFDGDITFHDPCYLGRYNDTYDEPRNALVQLSRKPLREMEQSKNLAMCCGAGGGHFWMDLKQGERINTLRVEQIAATGANTVATACPFCMHMLEDGVKLSNRETSLVVKDIAELVVENLK